MINEKLGISDDNKIEKEIEVMGEEVIEDVVKQETGIDLKALENKS